MGYSVHQVVSKDNGDEYFPERSGRWEVRDPAGQVVASYKFKYRADLAEWDAREYWTGPKLVRISEDGLCIECVYQQAPNSSAERVEATPLPSR